MNRMISLLCLICLLFSLCACQAESEPGCEFYYLQPTEPHTIGTGGSVLAAEFREIDPDVMSAKELIRLYLEGSVSDGFISPFPPGTTLERISIDDGHLRVLLSDEFSSLEGIAQTLASTCFCRTCFSLFDLQHITIQSQNESNTYSRSRCSV